MKIGICSALACKLDDSLKYIGVDHGVEILLKQGIKPVFAIGDFDSIENENVLSELDIERLPTRKDVTDTHAALEYALENGYDEVDIYGVTGGRLDHFLSVMCLLEKYADKKIRIIDQQNVIQLLLPGTHKVYQDEYKYFSLYALDDAYIDIDGADKFAPLLVSAYPTKLPMLMGEMSSDNVMDNGAQFDDMLLQEQLYLWEDPTGNDDDSPYGLWEACYNAIASANQALEGMDALGNPDNVKAQRGEALICRAYSHFLLANIFCMPYNPQTADQHLGIPYCKTTEKEVFVNYERGTLAQTYEQIAADIEEGLPLISDASYSVLKYHFNKKAANAFAARFYLYYQKWDQVIECADRVIGNNPGTSLRHWEEDFGELSLVSDVVSQYTSEKKVANLLISTAFSESGYVTGPWDIYKRYGHGQEIYKHQTIDTYGPWSVRGGLMMANFIISVLQKNPFPKITTFFEYTDKANNIGYAHTVVVPFTTDETILCRAEAYVLSSQHNYEKALEDINNWIVYHSVISEDEGADLTLEALNSFYDALPYEPALVNTVADRSLKKKLNPEGFTVNAGTEENLIQLILQLRRLEGLQEGLRWYDLKRYGIEFSHNRAGNVPIVLTKDDPRRAIQLPPDVINAGMKANPRN